MPEGPGPLGRYHGAAVSGLGHVQHDLVRMRRRPFRADGNGRITEGIADLEIPAARHGDELLAGMGEAHRSRIATGAGVELPEHLAGLGVVGVEVAVALTGEGESAGGGQRPAHHRLGNLILPGDLAGLEVHRREQPVLLLARDGDEGGAEPELALLPGRRVHDIVHRLMQRRHEGVAQSRIDRDR